MKNAGPPTREIGKHRGAPSCTENGAEHSAGGQPTQRWTAVRDAATDAQPQPRKGGRDKATAGTRRRSRLGRRPAQQEKPTSQRRKRSFGTSRKGHLQRVARSRRNPPVGKTTRKGARAKIYVEGENPKKETPPPEFENHLNLQIILSAYNRNRARSKIEPPKTDH